MERLYEELATSMTQLVKALAQLEGLHRLCSSTAGTHPALEECWAQLGPSREAAVSARAALERVLGDLANCEAPTDKMRQLRGNLREHGQSLLQRCKPSLNSAIARSRECEAHRPPPTNSTTSWATEARPAERYAFCETSCPRELLQRVGPEALPVPDESIAHGCIQILGIVATDMPEGGSRVDVVADVDPQVWFAFGVDRDVRHHVLNAADRLRKVVDADQRRQDRELADLENPARPLST